MNKENFIINELERNLTVFQSMLENNSSEESLFKPSPDKWGLLEIVCHLVDEEVHDFRARVRTALDEKQYPFHAIDPVGWVTERKDLEQNYKVKVAEWLVEREDSINWLKSLENPDWKSTFEHVDFGLVSTDHFLANWLAHDYIHIRQINRTKRAYLDSMTNEDLAYAGKW
jgi:hypothetical protein